MGLLKARIAGAWVDTDKVGIARVGGISVPYGPSGTPYEALEWPTPIPANPDNNDGSQGYNMGCSFTILTSRDAYGVQWRVPNTVATPPGGTHAVSVWNDDTNTRIGYKEFTAVPGGYQDVLFDSLVALSSGVNYICAVYTNHYVFTSGSPIGVDSPSGNIVAGAGRLAAYNSGAISAPIPVDTFTSTYYVSPLVAVA